MHAHPFLFSHVHADVFSLRHRTNDGARLEESSDEHAAWWLNSSSLLLHGAIMLFIAPQSTARGMKLKTRCDRELLDGQKPLNAFPSKHFAGVNDALRVYRFHM